MLFIILSSIVENEYNINYFNRLNYVKDAISKTACTYETNGLLKALEFSNVNNTTQRNNVSYTYENELIKTVTLNNGTVYTYNYDNYKNITSVLINNQALVNFTYNIKNQIDSVKYPSDSKYYYFVYDNDRIINVKYGSNIIKTYTYDNDLLKTVVDNNSGVTTTYVYNSDDKLVQVLDNSNENIVTYDYDHLGNVKDSKTNVHNFEVIKSINARGRASGSSTKGLLNRYISNGNTLACFYDDSINLKSSSSTSTGYYSSTFTPSNKVLPYIDLNASNRLYYIFNFTSYYYGGVAFWFKPTSLSSGSYIFKASFSYTSTSYLEVKYIDNKIKVLYDNSTLITIDNNIKLNEWNFFSLSWAYDTVVLHLNETRSAGSYTLGNIGLYNAITKYYLCYNPNNTSTYNAIPCQLTGLLVSKNTYLDLNSIYQYYAETKESLIDSTLIEDNSRLVNHGSVNEYDFNNIKSLFEIYPLNNSFNSITGKKPYELDLRRFNLDNDRSFNYDNNIKRYAYVADGSMLSYKFGNSNTATIALRICQQLRRSKQYLLYCYDSNNNVISLYTDINGVLKYDIGSTTYQTGKTINVNTWHDIVFSYDNTNDGYSGDINVRVVVDGAEYSNVITSSIIYQEMTTIIGRCKSFGTVSYSSYLGQYTCYPLYGLIEGLCYRAAYCELSTITSLFDNYNVTSVIYHYDELGRLTKKNIVNNDSSILSTNYIYYQSNGYNFRREIIKVNNAELTTINYKLDKRGNVTNVSDEVFGSRTYNYDFKGQLTNDDGNTIQYDDNGNIKSYDTITYTYDSIVKDKLISYNGNSISYGTNKLYPNLFGSLGIIYEGNKVSSITVGSDEYIYKYTNGLRTHKYLNGSLYYRYYYEGDKLISQYVNDINRDDFLYDSNGLLYAMVINKTNKYYYVRDMLQNIIGIIDSNGNLVVKYSYNAFGKVSIVDDDTYTLNSLVASRNPFRYKGYYYDEESSMYYCNSRYYNPEWGRWLTPDSIEYLDPSSINGLNLYAYCQNNPVNMYDPNGYSTVWVGLLLVGGFILLSLNGDYYTKHEEELLMDGKNFSFLKNNYSLQSSYYYAEQIKNSIYWGNSRRSVNGINLELILHYAVFALKIPKLKDHGEPAYIGDFVDDNDDTALLCEVLVGNGISKGTEPFIANDYSNGIGFVNKLKKWIDGWWPF